MDGLIKVIIREDIYSVKLAGLKVKFGVYSHKDVENNTNEGGGVYIEAIKRLFITSYI